MPPILSRRARQIIDNTSLDRCPFGHQMDPWIRSAEGIGNSKEQTRSEITSTADAFRSRALIPVSGSALAMCDDVVGGPPSCFDVSLEAFRPFG